MNNTASTLHYRLLDGPARLEPLRVLDARVVGWRGWRVTFRVLGASHAISLERDGGQLTELLTCAPPAGAAHALAELDAGTPGQLCVAARGLICRVRLTLFPIEEGDALRGDFAPASRLAVAFAAPPGGTAPWTRIGWQVMGRQLQVETVHTYPEEGRGVRSESLFTIAGEAL